MLVLHPSSSCDICMEDYELDSLAKTPHVIDCGHILCLTFVFILTNEDISPETEVNLDVFVLSLRRLAHFVAAISRDKMF
jgi:hypothetical protein